LHVRSKNHESRIIMLAKKLKIVDLLKICNLRHNIEKVYDMLLNLHQKWCTKTYELELERDLKIRLKHIVETTTKKNSHYRWNFKKNHTGSDQIQISVW